MARRPLRDEEPFVTIRAHPRRFAWGVPAVFIISIGAGLPLAERSLSLAIAVQLFIQTVGLLWLYLPVASWREGAEQGGDGVRREEGPGPGSDPGVGPEAGQGVGQEDEEKSEGTR